MRRKTFQAEGKRKCKRLGLDKCGVFGEQELEQNEGWNKCMGQSRGQDLAMETASPIFSEALE